MLNIIDTDVDINIYTKYEGPISIFLRVMQGTIRRNTVVIEDLERAANVSYPLQEVLQLRHRHLLNLVILSVVEPMSCKCRKLRAL